MLYIDHRQPQHIIEMHTQSVKNENWAQNQPKLELSAMGNKSAMGCGAWGAEKRCNSEINLYVLKYKSIGYKHRLIQTKKIMSNDDPGITLHPIMFG